MKQERFLTRPLILSFEILNKSKIESLTRYNIDEMEFAVGSYYVNTKESIITFSCSWHT